MARFEIPVTAGSMRQEVTLQTLEETSDAYGQLIRTWTDVGTYRCSIDQTAGGVAADAETQKAQRTGTITMRYFGEFDQTVSRFLFGSRVLTIVEVNNVGERNKTYKITYQEFLGGAAT